LEARLFDEAELRAAATARKRRIDEIGGRGGGTAGTERSKLWRATGIAISSASSSASSSGGAASLVARAAITVTSGGTSSEYRTPRPSSHATT